MPIFRKRGFLRLAALWAITGLGLSFLTVMPAKAATACSTPTSLIFGTIKAVSAVPNFTAGVNCQVTQLKLYASDGTTLLQNIQPYATGAVLSGLSPSTTYKASVTGIGDGQTYSNSAESALVSFTTVAVQTIGAFTTLSATSVTSVGATINFSATNALSYLVKVYSPDTSTVIESVNVNTTTTTLNSLNPGTFYKVGVQAIGDLGNWRPNTESFVTFTTLAAASSQLSTPTGLAVSSILASTATASFTTVAGAVSYNLRVYLSGTNTLVSVNPIAAASTALSGLSANTQYDVTVQARGDGITSLDSNESSRVTFTTLPAALNGKLSLATSVSSTGGSTTTLTFGYTTASGLTTACISRLYSNASPAVLLLEQVQTMTQSASTASYSVTFSGLTPATTYKYSVQCEATGYTTSDETALVTGTTLSVTPPITLPTPSIPTITLPLSTSLTVSWSAISNATGYTLKVYDSTGVTLRSTFTNAYSGIVVPDLTSATTYKFTVTAVGDGVSYGNSIESSPGSGTTAAALPTLATPPTPTISATSITTNSATVTFTLAANYSYSSITAYVYTNDGVTLFGTYNNFVSGGVISGLNPGSNYYVKLKAIGLTNVSSDSALSAASAVVRTLQVVSGSTPTALGTPSIITTPVNITPTTIYVQLSAAIVGVSNYQYKLYDASNNLIQSSISSSTALSFTNLTPGTVYYASAIALGDGANRLDSPESIKATFSTLASLRLFEPKVSLTSATPNQVVLTITNGTITGSVIASNMVRVYASDGTTLLGTYNNYSSGTTIIYDLTPDTTYVFTSTAIGDDVVWLTSVEGQKFTYKTPANLTLSAPQPYLTALTATGATLTYGAVVGVTSYTAKIYASDSSTVVAIIPGLTGTTATLTGLSPATKYWATVTAIGNGSTVTSSSESPKTEFTTLSVMQLMPPTVVATTNYPLPTSMAVTLTAPANQSVLRYVLKIYADDGTTLIFQNTNYTSAAQITGLVPNTKYKITVTSIGDGTSTLTSAESAFLQFLTPATVTLNAPTITATTSTSTTATVTFTINAPAVQTGFNLRLYAADGVTLIAEIPNYVSATAITGLDPNTAYYAAVAAIGNANRAANNSPTILDSPYSPKFRFLTGVSTVLAPPVVTANGINATPNSVAISFTVTTNSISTLLRIYNSDCTTLIGQYPAYTSGAVIYSPIKPGTKYCISLTAVGNGISYLTSIESPKVYVTTPSALSLPTPILQFSSSTPLSITLGAPLNTQVLAAGILYRVYAADGVTQLFWQASASPTSAFTFNSLLPSTKYFISGQFIGNGVTSTDSVEGDKVAFSTSSPVSLTPPGYSISVLSPNAVAINVFVAPTGAISYTARVYTADGNTLLSTSSISTSGSTAIGGLIPNTSYQISLTAIGDGIGYLNSYESPKALTTLPQLSVSPTVSPTQSWVSTYGGPFSDQNNAVTIGSDGSVFVGGSMSKYATFGTGSGAITLTAFGGYDGVFAKYSSTGEFQWIRQLGGTGDDVVKSVTSDKNGNIIVAGYFTGAATFGDGTNRQTVTSQGNTDCFVAKFSEDGTFLWVKQFGSVNADTINISATDANGNIFVGGYVTGVTVFGTGATRKIVDSWPGNNAGVIAKYFPDGTLAWTQITLAGTNGVYNSYVRGMATDSSGNLIVTGDFTQSVIVGVGATSRVLTSTTTGVSDVFIAKFATDGSVIWAQSAGGNGADYGSSVATDGSGNIFLTGYYAALNGMDLGSGSSSFSISNPLNAQDGFLAKFNSDGTPLWLRSFGGISNETTTFVIADASGNAYVTGYFYVSATFTSPNSSLSISSSGNADAFLAKFTSRGDLSWATRSGGAQTDVSYGLALDNSSNMYVAGYFSWDQLSLGGVSNYSFGTPGVMVSSQGQLDASLVKLNLSTSNSFKLAPPVPVITSVKSTSLNISFVSVQGATSYTVKRYDSTGTTLQATYSNFRSGGSITGLSVNTSYQFTVSAIGDGVATSSSDESLKVLSTTTINVPTPVVSMVAVDGFGVSWAPVAGATYYSLVVYAEDGVTKILNIISATQKLVTISNLLPNKTYKVAIRTIGDGSSTQVFPEGPQVSVTTKNPVQLSAPTPTVSLNNPTSIVVNFPNLMNLPQTLTGVVTYLVKLYKSDGTTFVGSGITNSTMTFNGLMPASTYKVSVTAIGDGVNYLTSSEGQLITTSTAQATKLAAPSATLGQSMATNKYGSYALYFAPVYGATTYVLRMYGSDGVTLQNTITSYTSGADITPQTLPNESVKFSLQSMGDGVNYFTSNESVLIPVTQLQASTNTLVAPTPNAGALTANSTGVLFSPIVGASSYILKLYKNDGTTLISRIDGFAIDGTVNNLLPNTTYKITLTAVGNNSISNTSAESSQLTVTTLNASILVAPLPAVNALTRTSFKVNYSTVTGATSYTLKIFASDGTTLVSTIPNYSSSAIVAVGLQPGTQYKVGLIAKGDGIAYTDSPISLLVSANLVVSTQLVPPVPEPFRPTASNVTIQFATSPNAINYTMKLYTNSGTLIATNPAFAAGGIIASGLAPSTTYKVSITAIGDGTNFTTSAESDKVPFTTLAPVQLSAPFFALSSSSPRSIQATITPVFGAPSSTSYQVRLYNEDGSKLITNFVNYSSNASIGFLLPNTTYRVTLRTLGDGFAFTSSNESSYQLITTAPSVQLKVPVPVANFVNSTTARISFPSPPILSLQISYVGKLYDSTGNYLLATMPVSPAGTNIYGLTAGTTYKFSVTARGDGLTYLSSTESSLITLLLQNATPGTQLVSPTPTTNGATTNSITVAFAASTSASSYTAKVYASDGTTVLYVIPSFTTGQVIEGLSPSTTYKVSITAIGDGTIYLNGNESTKVSFTTANVVANQSATQLINPSITIGARTSTSFTVNYSSVTGAQSYLVKVYATDGTTLLKLSNLSSGTAITGLLPNTSYKVSIQTLGDGVNYASAAESAEVSAKTGLAPPSASEINTRPTSTALSFNAIVGSSSYTVKRYAADGTTLQQTYNSYSSGTDISGLSPSTTYKFRIKSIGDGTTTYDSDDSDLISITTPPAKTLATPVLTVSSTSSTSITYTFSSIADSFSYTLKRYASDGTTLLGELTNFTSGSTVSGLSSGTTYKATLTAIGDGGIGNVLDSAASSIVSANTVSQVTLTAPTPTFSSVTTTSAVVNFTSVTGATSYLMKMYAADGLTLIQSISNFTSGTPITDLLPVTNYKISIKAFGDGASYLNSTEGNKVLLTTSASTALAAPAPVIGSITPNSFAITFSSISNATDYVARIYSDDKSTVLTSISNFTSGTLINNLNSGTAYYVTLQSLSGSINYSNSAESSQVLAQTSTPTTLTAPVPVLGTKTSASANFSFTGVSGALSYVGQVLASDKATVIFSVPNLNPAGTTVSGLEPNTTYWFGIRSIGDEANYVSSSLGTLVSVTTNNAAKAISSPIPTLNAAGSTSISIYFNSTVGATSYTVKLYNAAGNSLISTYTNFNSLDVITGLTINTTYSVSITAIGDGGFNLDGTESSKVLMATAAPTTLSTPSPSISSYTSQTGVVVFTAQDLASAFTAKIYAANGTSLLQTITGFNSGDVVSGLTPSTIYKISITAIGDGISVLDSSESTKISLTTSAPTALDAPTPVVASVTTNSVQVIYTGIDGALSHTLKVYASNGTTLIQTLNSFTSSSSITSLAANTTYILKMQAIGDGTFNTNSALSSGVEFTTLAQTQLIAPIPTIGSATLNSFQVTFTGVSGATSYTAKLYASDGSTLLNTVPGIASGDVISNLTPSTKYFVSLIAIGDGTTTLTSLEGDSVFTTTSTQPSLNAPSPSSSSITTTSFSFTFSAITNAVSYNAKLYNDIYLTDLARDLGTVTSPKSVTGLSPGTDYYLSMQTVANGTSYLNSAWSSGLKVTTNSLTVLSTPSMAKSAATVNSVTMNWSSISNASSYQIKVYADATGTLINTIDNATSPQTITGLTTDTAYYLAISAIGDGTTYLTSPESLKVTVRTNSLDALSAPTPIAANVTPSTAVINFSPVVGASAYKATILAEDAVTTINTISNVTPGQVITDLLDGRIYYVSLQAIGDGINYTNSSASLISFSTLGHTVLNAPVPTLGSATDKKIVINFNNILGADSYTLKVYSADASTLLNTISNFSSGGAITGLESNTTYQFTLTSIGDGDWYLNSSEGNFVSFATEQQIVETTPITPTPAPSYNGGFTYIPPTNNSNDTELTNPTGNDQNGGNSADKPNSSETGQNQGNSENSSNGNTASGNNPGDGAGTTVLPSKPSIDVKNPISSPIGSPEHPTFGVTASANVVTEVKIDSQQVITPMPLPNIANLPVIAPGSAVKIVGNDLVAPEIKLNSSGSIIYSLPNAPSQNPLNLSITNSFGVLKPISNPGELLLNSGDNLSLSGSGYKPNSIIKVWIFSSPFELGRVQVDGNGNYKTSLKIPDNFESGTHTVQINGLLNDQTIDSISLGVQITKPATQKLKLNSGKVVVSYLTYTLFLPNTFINLDTKTSQYLKLIAKQISGKTINCVNYFVKGNKNSEKASANAGKAVCELLNKLAKPKNVLRKSLESKFAPSVGLKSMAGRSLRIDIYVAK